MPTWPGQLLVEDVFRPGHLDLQVVVSGTQGADLLVPPLHGLLADLGGVRARHAAVLLGPLQILLQRVSLLQAPAHPLLAQRCGTPRATASESPCRPPRRGCAANRRSTSSAQPRLDLLLGQGGGHQTHAAVDVEADAPGRDDPGLGVEGRHARRWETRSRCGRRACRRSSR